MNVSIPDFKNFKTKEKRSRIKTLFGGITKIVNKDSGVLKPTYSMIIFSFIQISALFFGIISIIEKSSYSILAILIFLVLTVWKHFFFVKKSSFQSILIHQTMVSGSTDINIAKQEYSKISNKMFLVGLADFFIGSGTKNGLQSKNIIIRILLSILAEVRDLLKNFMIPVISIEKKPIREAVEDLKVLRGKIPEALIGILGFDLAGTFLIGALFPIFLLILILSIGVSYLIPIIGTVNTIEINTINFSISGFIFGVYLIFLISSIVFDLAISVKTAYFTILYTMIVHPESIKPDIMPKLVNFVEMKNGM